MSRTLDDYGGEVDFGAGPHDCELHPLSFAVYAVPAYRLLARCFDCWLEGRKAERREEQDMRVNSLLATEVE
jgi:hypothetical protein